MEPKLQRAILPIAAFCLAMAEMMSGYTNVFLSSVLFAFAAGLGSWFVLIDSPIKLSAAKRFGRRWQLAGSLLIAVLVYCFSFTVLSGHAESETAREAENEARWSGLEKSTEVNNTLIRELAQTLISKENPSASSITPLTKTGSSETGGGGAIAISSPRPGDELTATVGKVHVRLKVISASKSGWRWMISELSVGENIRISGMDFNIEPGIPICLVLGKDLALVASVITLESGVHIPWVGLVPPDLAPPIRVVDARPNSLLTD